MHHQKAPVLDVVAGVIQDATGRVLISKRHQHQHQGGLWEFPGGKREPGESKRRALARELYEEIGIRVISSEPLLRVFYRYQDQQVRLHFRQVTGYQGKVRSREKQQIDWRLPINLPIDEFPAADRPLVNRLQLPDRMLIAGPVADGLPAFLLGLGQALASGIKLVQLRAPQLDRETYGRLAQMVAKLCRQHRTYLMLNPPAGMAYPSLGDGLHLNSARLMQTKVRPEEGRSVRIGASCHDLVELRHAERMGLDYALLSPVKPTASHPDAIPMGWKRFAELARQVSLPVYALGGMGAKDVRRAICCGGQGIAAMRGLWPG